MKEAPLLVVMYFSPICRMMAILILVFNVMRFRRSRPLMLAGFLIGFSFRKNPENNSRMRFEASTELSWTL